MTLKTICKLAQFMLTVIAVQLPDLDRGGKWMHCASYNSRRKAAGLPFVVPFVLIDRTTASCSIICPEYSRIHSALLVTVFRKKKTLLLTHVVLSSR